MNRDRTASSERIDHRGIQGVTRCDMITARRELAREIPEIAPLACAEVGPEAGASPNIVDPPCDHDPSDDRDENQRRADDGHDAKIA